MGELLAAALTELSVLKPKYPTLDVRESAVKFLALYLKVRPPVPMLLACCICTSRGATF